ncbi:MAG TPA: protein kinase, partial [Kofleriaceae bacterium]|nr:protein kinase [Kofleriaceae bacterium]
MGNSPARAVVDVGSIIADTYTIEALIGRGGMGAVFLASHRRLPGKKVAIKLLHAELTDDEVVARFRREALIASQLNHPNIVDVTDFNVTADGTPYLVLEYLHGESLAARIKDGPMPLEGVLSIVRQVGSAVAAAHREGIVHRDLKPQNIFLVPKEVDGRIVEIAKVLDFGISKIRGSQTVQTQESTLLGTPQYMAPEQATGQHTLVDERTDVFALGAIVYEMLSGQPAFSGASIPEVVFKVVYEEPAPLADRVPGLPPAVAAAVARAMAKPAADRFPSVGAFVEALTGQPLLQVRAGALPPPEVGFAAGSRHRSTGHDAFAQTMGSVDQGTLPMTAAVPAGTASPPPPSSTARPTVPARGEDLAPRGDGVPTVAPPADRPR